MKTDIVQIDNFGNGFAEALAQTKKAAQFRDLGPHESARLELIADEMLNLARSITGEMQASFWIESDALHFALNMTTKTVMDKEKRRLLIDSTTSHKNASANSFISRLRDAFEEAMLSDTSTQLYELPADIQADLAGRDFQSPEWDHYEQSVLFRLADDVSIGIRGGMVSMTVTKNF